jgi:ribosomal protein L21E
MKTYEVRKTTEVRYRHGRTGRIWASESPAWLVYIDGQWTGKYFPTKKAAQAQVEHLRDRE